MTELPEAEKKSNIFKLAIRILQFILKVSAMTKDVIKWTVFFGCSSDKALNGCNYLARGKQTV